MPIPWNNLGDVIDRSIDPARPAIVDLRRPDQPVTYSYAELDRASGGVAHYLSQAGLPAGAHIAIAALNRIEFIAAYFGIMRAGFVAVPLNIKAGAETLAYVIADADIQLAFVDGPRRTALAALVPIVDFDDQGPAGFAAVAPPAAFATVPPAADQVAQMLYTSGSTGRPKGVPLTHAGQLWALATIYPPAVPDRQDHYLVAQPFFHMNGLFVLKRAIAGGALLVVLPAFDVAPYADALARYGITHVTAVPTMFARLVNRPEVLAGRDFSALQRIALASAPMTVALLDRIQAAFPAAQIAHGYGTTEAGPAVFGPHPDGVPTPKLGLGYPLGNAEVRLTGGATPDDGILQMRNPAVMHGYHGLPEKNAKVLADGWYDSGDVMRRDAEGFYYFVGRADDMFVCSGENIYPGEVEKLIETHPDVRQACVVPLPDEERSQMPVAFVVAREGSALTAEAVKHHALANGPGYQHPRRVALVAELPWAGTNKVDRHALLQRARDLEARGEWQTHATVRG
ncbi:class I adenylate-forming enzyme family protein [Alcaligenaceae bacterium A4P071]|nr:class I adenylate-forming enzyme family protein [Alcaligenaceae bacterium A4P071]